MEKPLKEEYIGERFQGLPMEMIFACVMQPKSINACVVAINQINSYLMVASKGGFSLETLKDMSLYQRARYFDEFSEMYKESKPKDTGTVEEE